MCLFLLRCLVCDVAPSVHSHVLHLQRRNVDRQTSASVSENDTRATLLHDWRRDAHQCHIPVYVASSGVRGSRPSERGGWRRRGCDEWGSKWMTEAMTLVATHSHNLQLPHQTPPSARLQHFIPSIRFKHPDGSHIPHIRVISGRQDRFGEQNHERTFKMCNRINKTTTRFF